MEIQAWAIFISLASLLGATFWLGNIRIGAALALSIMLGSVWAFDTPRVEWILPLGNGLVISLELLLLLFGALLFYEVLSVNGHFAFIDELITSVPSPLAIAMILCVFLASFFEGIAGFGIPAMLVAPLMHKAGFKNLSSILLPLAANPTAVTFGALGTPLKIGLGITQPNEAVFDVVCLNTLPAFCLPWAVALLFGRSEHTKVLWKEEWPMLFGAGLCFALPYFGMSFFTVEFPSVVAGGLGLIAFIVCFVKTTKRLSFRFWLQAFYPYGMFIGLLLLLKEVLHGQQIHFHESLRPFSLFQPGAIFLLAVVLYLFILALRKQDSQFRSPLAETMRKVKDPLLTILLLVCYSQLIGKGLAAQVGVALDLLPKDLGMSLLPFVGMGGSFVTGSATMSNLLLGGIASSTFPIYLSLALALLHTGGALGNVIALQNIVMVKSVLHSTLKEGKVIKHTVWVALGYSLLVIAIMQVLMVV